MLALVGVDAATYAATGDSLLLGRVNEADGLTTLRNTGTGATLRLVSSGPNRPNLDLSSAARIYNMNADLLDGMDASQLVHGGGEVRQGANDVQLDTSQTVITTPDPGLTVDYRCPQDLAANGTLVLTNQSSGTVNTFSDNGTSNPYYQPLGWSDELPNPTAPAGEHITLHVQGLGPRIVTFEVYSVHRSGDCHAQAQAVVTR